MVKIRAEERGYALCDGEQGAWLRRVVGRGVSVCGVGPRVVGRWGKGRKWWVELDSTWG